jgi:hypothetical protein
MKRNILMMSAFALTLSALLFNGCKKDDTTAPVVTLTGPSSTTVSLNSSAYVDAGATANDDEDGSITPTMSGSVDVNQAGTYTITWTATDAAGNSGTASRTVTVKNDAEAWAGTYPKALIVDSVFSNSSYTAFVQLYTWAHDMVVTASPTVNNKLFFEPFSDYSGIAASETIYGNVTGSSVTIPSQTAHSIGTPTPEDHTFQGSGVYGTFLGHTGIRLTTSDHTTSGTAYDVVYFIK